MIGNAARIYFEWRLDITRDHLDQGGFATARLAGHAINLIRKEVKETPSTARTVRENPYISVR